MSTILNTKESTEKGGLSDANPPPGISSFALVNVSRKIFNRADELLTKYLFTDESLSKPEKVIFSRSERWNIFMYIAGIMCYKFALEQYNGTIKALAIDRYTALLMPVYTYSGYLDGFQAMTQCVGSIIVGPLMSLFPIKTVLWVSLLLFSIISMLVMCIENATGGTFPTKCVSTDGLPPKCTGAIAGDWNPIGIMPIYILSGIPFGAIEIIRRIIPQQIVGANEAKLKKLDSLVHIYFEIAGTTGAFFAAYVCLILGKAYAPVISPPLFMIAACFFYYIVPPSNVVVAAIAPAATSTREAIYSFARAVGVAFYGFGESVYEGGRIIFLETRFRWLFFGYTIPLVMHRYIESGVASVYAKLVLGESAYASFINAGSNFGELSGAAFVLFNLNLIKTPLPTVRWDALVLNFSWLFYNVVTPDALNIDPANAAGVMAAIMCFISAGWSAGDVSMAAYIQAQIPHIKTPGVSIANALSSVMSFLYVSCIVIFAVISPMIGNWLDDFSTRANEAKAQSKVKGITSAQKAYWIEQMDSIKTEQKEQYFYWIAGVFFSLVSVTIFFNTFLPKGSWAFNPVFDEPAVEEEIVNQEEAPDVVINTTPDDVSSINNTGNSEYSSVPASAEAIELHEESSNFVNSI